MTKPHERLMELLDKVLDNSSSPDEHRELTELLENSTTLPSEFLQQMQTHSLLQLQGRREHGLARFASLLPNERTVTTQLTNRKKSVGLWAVAICLIVGSLIMFMQFAGQQDDIAEIIDDRGATWSSASAQFMTDGVISKGRLELIAGDVTLQFRSGAVVNASGPVTMNIESDMLVYLEQGQASAHVPKWAKGFTIETPDVEVIDLGTRFGVLARDDKSTDVVVFEGEVDLKPSFADDAGQRRLYQGEGVRVTNQGQIDRVVEVRRDSDDASWSTGPSSSKSGVIRSIRDNIMPSSSVKYYEVVKNGLDEDVRAYVDRVHEWNGYDGEGLPDFLKGIEYVRTFNDNKYVNNLQIELEIGKAATVYIFFDDRVPPPDWLISNFEDTGYNIGLDEGPWSYVDSKGQVIADLGTEVGVGSGNSIEQRFSVWKHQSRTPENLTLGPMGEQLGARAIYGIAAAPL